MEDFEKQEELLPSSFKRLGVFQVFKVEGLLCLFHAATMYTIQLCDLFI